MPPVRLLSKPSSRGSPRKFHMSKPQPWRTYEDVARFLLNTIAGKLGLTGVEGKQNIAGKRSGTSWEIDAKGISSDGEGFVVIEVRRHTAKRLSQEAVAALAFRIEDTGASGGIVVSPMPLQSGAQKVASSANIVAVQMNKNSTTEQYVLRFLKQVMIGQTDAVALDVPHPIGGALTRVRRANANDERGV